MTLQQEIEAKTKALHHCLYVIECRRSGNRTADYIAACDDIKLSIEAAIERLENGEQMEATAETNNQEHRMLDIGETITKTDEWNFNGRWFPTPQGWVGTRLLKRNHGLCRRPILKAKDKENSK